MTTPDPFSSPTASGPASTPGLATRLRAAYGPAAGRRSLRTTVAILIGNLIPIFGVIFLGWDAAQILLLYWCENVIIGVLTLPRLLTAQGVKAYPPAGPGEIQIRLDGLAGKLFLTVFFIVHYGIFCAVHGLFTVLLAGGSSANPVGLISATAQDRTFQIAIAAIVLVQLVVLVREWWLSGLFRRSDPGTEMFRPYSRILVLHMTVIIGAWGMMTIGASTWAILVLCAFKTIAEWITQPRTLPEADRVES